MMDKSWMGKPRNTDEYMSGIADFMKFAIGNMGLETKFRCPCKICCNQKSLYPNEVASHLLYKGIIQSYNIWTLHGEKRSNLNQDDISSSNNISPVGDDMHGMLHEAFQIPIMTEEEIMEEHVQKNTMNITAERFYKLLVDVEKELYPGCKKYNKLSFIVRLFNIKSKYGWSDVSFNELLDFLRDILPEGHQVPETFYQTKKVIKDLGLDYDKIDACENHCMLFWQEIGTDGLEQCTKCGSSRWKISQEQKVAKKIVRYFPLIPRLQRMYMSSKVSSFMTWHAEGRTKNDGKLRHPADSLAWQNFDLQHPSFSSEIRNVRLGLASDGFNPFRTLSSTYSIWPVVLIPYNLPPWMCMKENNLMLSCIIPGETQPGMKIDVYLQPLIRELQLLWNDGVQTYDAARKESFLMRAILLWTISDFPGYAYLSGWSTKGAKACPVCNDETEGTWLEHSKKHCYMNHRRFLKSNHKFRKDSSSFNGTVELRKKPSRLSTYDVMEQLNLFEHRPLHKKKKNNDAPTTGWRKKSIFFELPYWETMELRHNLDVMHIEKNVCESLLYTLLNSDGKSKDHLNARLDLQQMGLRPSLHPYEGPSGRLNLPPACYTLSKSEQSDFLQVLKDVKVPRGYASNISHCVQMESRKIQGLKSHDCHILMQQLFPLAIRKVLPMNVTSTLIGLSAYFRNLCSKELDVDSLLLMDIEISEVLCNMEKIFPPSFFDVMVHLVVHLAEEARLGGPVQYRWMYFVERKHMSELKASNVGMRLGDIEKCHFKEFPIWFRDHVNEFLNSDEQQSKMLRWLAKGSLARVRHYIGFDINGMRFLTQERDNKGKCQNSGVLVNAQTPNFLRMEEKIAGMMCFRQQMSILQLVVMCYFRIVSCVNLLRDPGFLIYKHYIYDLEQERDADEAGGRPLHGGEQEDGAGLPRPSVVGVRLRLPPHGLQTKKKVKKNSAPRTNGCAGQKNVSSYKTVLPDAIAPQQNHSNDAQAICLLGFNFERVAEGKIISKDPKKQLGAQPLGDEYYEVQVTKVLKPNMRLPTDWNKMLGQCEGDCIPWMKSA